MSAKQAQGRPNDEHTANATGRASANPQTPLLAELQAAVVRSPMDLIGAINGTLPGMPGMSVLVNTGGIDRAVIDASASKSMEKFDLSMLSGSFSGELAFTLPENVTKDQLLATMAGLATRTDGDDAQPAIQGDDLCRRLMSEDFLCQRYQGYVRAAAEGVVEAVYMVGCCHTTGMGCDLNFATAFEWLVR
jgi:hypothetical protein